MTRPVIALGVTLEVSSIESGVCAEALTVNRTAQMASAYFEIRPVLVRQLLFILAFDRQVLIFKCVIGAGL
jgi:hypothetical protein